jgi:hypothetical protein
MLEESAGERDRTMGGSLTLATVNVVVLAGTFC